MRTTTPDYYPNIDPDRKNYVIVEIRKDGRARIALEAMTDDELADEAPDYFDLNAITELVPGESCEINDGAQMVLRIY